MHGLSLHLKEAYELNSERAKLYNNRTNGRSYPIHRKLIWGEWASMYTSKIPDIWAGYFHRRGVPIMELDFISMSLVNDYSESFPFPVDPLDKFVKRDIPTVVKGFKQAYKLGSFQALSKSVETEIALLANVKTYHHMYRHVLDSLLRLSNHAPMHVRLAKEKGIRFSPVWLSRYLLWAHLISLKFSYDFDQEMAPIQAENIPIIFNEVPPVPPISSFYLEKGF